MKIININVISRNIITFKKFNLKKFNNLIVLLEKYKIKKIKTKKLTILKSPHVNKKAQEQFESKIFTKNLNYTINKFLKFLVLLKRFKNYLFFNLKIKLKFMHNNSKNQNLKKKIILPKNFNNTNINNFFNLSIKNKKYNKLQFKNFLKWKGNNLLQLLDIYGEFKK